MTATLSIDAKRQMVLPKRFCEHARIRPGSKVRVTPVEGGLLLAPDEPSWEEELREVERASGLPRGREPKNAMEVIKRALAEIRQQK
jgi:bifunctional DNA-binding transcriptional regulator/antitoxin component of YhaV-PrlF toxin-antitoxin module